MEFGEIENLQHDLIEIFFAGAKCSFLQGTGFSISSLPLRSHMNIVPGGLVAQVLHTFIVTLLRKLLQVRSALCPHVHYVP